MRIPKNSSTWEVEAGDSEIHGDSQLHGKLETSLG